MDENMHQANFNSYEQTGYEDEAFNLDEVDLQE